MSQQFPSWRAANGQTRNGETLWLSMLIEAMEKFSLAEWRTRPVDSLELAAVRAHLARPVTAHSAYGSHFSLRN